MKTSATSTVQELYTKQGEKFSFDGKMVNESDVTTQKEILMSLYKETGKQFDSDQMGCNACKTAGDLLRTAHVYEVQKIDFSKYKKLDGVVAFSRVFEVLCNIERDTQIGHFKTDSSSQHEVLGRLYKMLTEAKDKIVEVCQGKYGRKKLRTKFAVVYDTDAVVDASIIIATALNALELLKKIIPDDFPAMGSFDSLIEGIYQLKDVSSRQ